MTEGSLSGVSRVAYDKGAMAAHLPTEPEDTPGDGKKSARMRPQASGSARSTQEDMAVSERVSEFRQALRVVKSTHDVRAARVSALRAQIRAGTYRADPELIARRIMEQGL